MLKNSVFQPSSSTVPMSEAMTMTREFSFTSADFERVRKLIHAYAGISLSVAKQDMVYSRLVKRLRATRMATFSAYLDFLEKGDKVEWQLFVNALTTNLTSFFREEHHFPLLADFIKKKQGGHPLRIWCCAASTGEEPYSIAITILEAIKGASATVSLLATDIDTHVLQVAAAGIYTEDRFERMSPERIKNFFNKLPTDASFVAKPELKRLITFQRLNLLDVSWAMQGKFDVIFCRNVMIYFDKPTQYKILSRFVPLLQSDGMLITGHSESFLHAADLFRSIGKTTYELARPAAR